MDLTFWKRFLRLLLPTSAIYNIVVDRGFKSLLAAVGSVLKSAHDYVGARFTDFIPAITTRIDDWSEQFGFSGNLSILRLEAEWKQSAGQSPHFIQTKLHDAGFTNCYIHEWWVPASSPVTARNPIPYINDYQPNNLLVNPMSSLYEDFPQCGDAYQCGDDLQCGDSDGYKYEEKIYPHPDIADEYPYYFYVCGATFGNPVTLDSADRFEVQKIIYKYKPMHLRCVLLNNDGLWINTPYTGDEIWINTPYTGTEVYINIGDR